MGSQGSDAAQRGPNEPGLPESRSRTPAVLAGALTLLTTTTRAVHHRCITATAFGDLPRACSRSRQAHG
jgi:hypothetical protein